MVKKTDLNELNLLIVDPDAQLAQVCAQSLRTMGFGTVNQVRNVADALVSLKKTPADIVITESAMQPQDGLSLIRDIRASEELARRIISIIMLTARAEPEDVKAARDAGINEFIVKPFTAKALFARLEQIIDNPRSFVFAKQFVGPDRRRRDAEAPEGNKRQVAPKLKEKTKVTGPSPEPVALKPDYALKEKVGLDGKLASVVTPEIITRAQTAIEDFREMSQAWIATDIHALLMAQRLAFNGNRQGLKDMEKLCLSLKGRAGMFGHSIVSEIAQLFYTFLRKDYRVDHAPHHLIAQKFSEALHAAFSSDMTSRDIRMGQALVQDLRKLTQKFADA